MSRSPASFRTTHRHHLHTAASLFLAAAFLTACGGATPLHGPKSGTLMIIGGNASVENYHTFIELAGGPDAHIVVVPTAGGAETYDAERIQNQWRERYGANNVTVLHTTDPAIADTEEFAAPLFEADAVFFLGGRQWHLVDSYEGTRTLDGFWSVLERGGVIAGSSAGASIQASFLARGAEQGNTLMIAPEEEHRAGFGFLKQAAVDQHINTRDRWHDLRVIILEHPDLLGIGISERTAIIVRGDIIQVVGAAQVAIHDAYRSFSYADSTYLQLLEPGDWFDMRHRHRIPEPEVF